MTADNSLSQHMLLALFTTYLCHFSVELKFVALMDLNTLIVHENTFTSFTCYHSVPEGWADAESTLGM